MMCRMPSHVAVIRVHDDPGNVIEMHEHDGDSSSGEVLHDQTDRKLVYRPLQFHKRSQLFLGAHDEASIILAFRLSDAAAIPSDFAEIVSDVLIFMLFALCDAVLLVGATGATLSGVGASARAS